MNAYNKLRPQTTIETCKCGELKELLLADLLSRNPIQCAICRHEVDPERLALSQAETESIAQWFSAASALYRLWLHSGEYEAYAKEQLLDAEGQINREGRELAVSLSRRLPTRFWYFHDTDDEAPTNCPVCEGSLDTNVDWGTGFCRDCHIQM